MVFGPIDRMLQSAPSKRPLLNSLLGLARQAWSSSGSSSSSSSFAAEQQAGRALSGQQCSSSSLWGPPARPPREPWTPSRLLDKRKAYPKRMRHLITVWDGTARCGRRARARNPPLPLLPLLPTPPTSAGVPTPAVSPRRPLRPLRMSTRPSATSGGGSPTSDQGTSWRSKWWVPL